MKEQPFDPGVQQGLSGGCRIIPPDGDHEKYVKAGATMVHSSTMNRKALRFVGLDLSGGTIKEITPLGSINPAPPTPMEPAPIPEQSFSIPSTILPVQASIAISDAVPPASTVAALVAAPPSRPIRKVLLEVLLENEKKMRIPFQYYEILFNKEYRILTFVTPLELSMMPEPGMKLEVEIEGARHYCDCIPAVVIPNFGISVLQLTYSLEKPSKKESSQPDSAPV